MSAFGPVQKCGPFSLSGFRSPGPPGPVAFWLANILKFLVKRLEVAEICLFLGPYVAIFPKVPPPAGILSPT